MPSGKGPGPGKPQRDDSGMSVTDPLDDPVPARWWASAEHLTLWAAPDDDLRFAGTSGPFGRLVAVHDERSMLIEYLRTSRLALQMKCADLGPAQLAARSVPPSTMCLLGLVRHMADVERYWFRRVMAAQLVPSLYDVADRRGGAWDVPEASPEVVAEAWESWRSEVAFAEQYVAETGDLATVGRTRHGEPLELRVVLLHMINEYARHCGHADLLRERTDGRVGF